MNRTTIIYWFFTLLFCATMSAGGVANLLRTEEQLSTFDMLGYPTYLLTVLGVAKLLGVVALIVPGVPLLKEWAYAGFAFDLIGAAASHIAVDHPNTEPWSPLIVLAIGGVSYWLRPASRCVQAGGES
ncbi:MAG: DoxX family protein [Pirellulales bacterium]|nr:DoxX family protein [Pirellulales bacterium]